MNPTQTAVRGASTSAAFAPKDGMVGVSVRRDALPARRALPIFVASLAVGLLPIRLGEIEATGDAASLLLAQPVASPLVDEAAPRAYVRERASRSGWEGRQWRCLVALVDRENRAWDPTAKNRQGSSAYGLFQILRTPVGTPLSKQWERFERYIAHRYDGDVCAAYRFHLANGHY